MPCMGHRLDFHRLVQAMADWADDLSMACNSTPVHLRGCPSAGELKPLRSSREMRWKERTMEHRNSMCRKWQVASTMTLPSPCSDAGRQVPDSSVWLPEIFEASEVQEFLPEAALSDPEEDSTRDSPQPLRPQAQPTQPQHPCPWQQIIGASCGFPCAVSGLLEKPSGEFPSLVLPLFPASWLWRLLG